MRRVSIYKVFETSMEPRDFCRRWFAATAEEEAARGYRGKCVFLLSEILKVKENTIQRWGSGLEFENMPEPYKATLAYVDIIRCMIEATHGQTDLLPMVLTLIEQRKN